MESTPLINVLLTKEQAITFVKVIYKYGCCTCPNEEEEWLKELADNLVDLLGRLSPKAIANAAAFDAFVRSPEDFTITLEGQENNP